MSPKKKHCLKVKVNPYQMVEDAIESGLGFAINRLEDHMGDGLSIPENVRDAARDSMMNEIMIALEGVIDWEGSN